MREDGANLEQQTSDAPPGDGGAGLMFWILVALSLSVLTPCLLLPAWREYQAAELTQRALTREVTELDTLVSREKKLLNAIHNDPAVVSRLAQRELEYRVPGAEVVPAPGTLLQAHFRDKEEAKKNADASTDGLKPTPLPVALTRLAALLPAWNYDALFCASPTREMMMGLAIVTLISAFIVFWPRVEAGDDDDESDSAEKAGANA